MTDNAHSPGGGRTAWLRRVPSRAGLTVAALGIFVIIAWFMRWRMPIQVLPGLPPMKFNTALGFICCGSALALLAIKRKKLIATRKAQGLQATIDMESSGRGFALVSQVQNDLQAFTGEEEQPLDERSKTTEVDFHNTERLLVFGSVLAAMLLIFANGMTNREIKRRRRAERMQERLATEIKGLLEASGEGIYGIDVNGCCTFINAAGIRLVGYETYEVLGKNIHDLIHHSRRDGSAYPQEECPINLAFKSDLSCRVDSEVFWRKDRSSFLVEYTSFPIVEDSAIKGAVVTFSDISERKQHEAEREKLIDELQQALAEVKTLSGMIPICGWCKNVRSDTGFWQNVEQYIRSRTDAKFSHGICPACAEKFKAEISQAKAAGVRL